MTAKFCGARRSPASSCVEQDDSKSTAKSIVQAGFGAGVYNSYFKDPSGQYVDPIIQVQYLADDAVDTLLLAEPSDSLLFNPLEDVEQTLFTFARHVIPLSKTEDEHIASTFEACVCNLECARRRGSLQEYLTTLEKLNGFMLELKQPLRGGRIQRILEKWENDGPPQNVLLRILDEAYDRSVRPKRPLLSSYKAFSSNVYGELMPSFVTTIIQQTKLDSRSLFLDLGSGVANIVLQVALEVRCRVFGIEIREEMARLSLEHLQEMRLRCLMWGVQLGVVELEQGDMLRSARVDELLSSADVVLVNNYSFDEDLNGRLRTKFLELKHGAFIISLKPFIDFRSYKRGHQTNDGLDAMLDVFERRYNSEAASWSGASRPYYVHRVNLGKKFSRRQGAFPSGMRLKERASS